MSESNTPSNSPEHTEATSTSRSAVGLDTGVSFAELGLHERLLKALDKQGMSAATPVQAQALPAALTGRDLMVSAETGSGKTAAYLLPVLQQLLARPAPHTATRALILVPTRELARQVQKDCQQLAAFTPLGVEMITGGVEFKYQRALLRKNPEVVIATPGRMLEHLNRQNIELSDLEMLVLDEADRMLDLGFGEDVLSIAAACRPDHQTLLYSATLRHEGVNSVAHKVLHDPEHCLLNQDEAGQQHIRQQIVLADDVKHKQRLLVRLLELESYEQALVFTNTRDMADQLGHFLKYHRLRVAVLHGEMQQDDRNRVMELFRKGQVNVLVATDVAARGLDVRDVGLVINFDMTRNGDDHVHRVGRTGRFGAAGLAISMVMSTEWNLMASIERYLRVKFERRLVKGLEGRYKGPKKLKASGKAASESKRKTGSKAAEKVGGKKPKTKERQRDRKAIGKRRKPVEQGGGNAASDMGDGFAPLKKR